MSAVMNINPERRQHNQHLVSELRQERHEVWSLYCQVAELKPFNCSSETRSILNKFSQLLIDYISLGHFGIYEYLLSGSERRALVLTEAQKVYPEFSETTEAAIRFNDKYDDNKPTLKIEKLEDDLSALGESLAKRIEIEDLLCRLVLT